MPALLDGDLVMLSISGTCFGQRIVFTHSMQVINPDESNDYLEVMTNILSGLLEGATKPITAKYLACVSSDYTATAIRAQRIWPTRNAFVEIPVEYPGTSSAANAANLMAALTLRTDKAGRNQVSTRKIGPIGFEDAEEGLITSNFKSRMQTLADELISNQEVANIGLGLEPVVIHRDAETHVITGSDGFTNWTVQDQVRTMSRRTVGRGE